MGACCVRCECVACRRQQTTACCHRLFHCHCCFCCCCCCCRLLLRCRCRFFCRCPEPIQGAHLMAALQIQPSPFAVVKQGKARLPRHLMHGCPSHGCTLPLTCSTYQGTPLRQPSNAIQKRRSASHKLSRPAWSGRARAKCVNRECQETRAKSRFVRACQQVCVEAWQQKRQVLGHFLKQPPCLDHNHP